MGTEFYLIDSERKIAFYCHKWYAISRIVGRSFTGVTADHIMATEGGSGRCNQQWLRVAAIRWMLWHGLGSAQLVHDEGCEGYPPEQWLDAAGWRCACGGERRDETEADHWARHGWELCSLWGPEAAAMVESLGTP